MCIDSVYFCNNEYINKIEVLLKVIKPKHWDYFWFFFNVKIKLKNRIFLNGSNEQRLKTMRAEN